MYVQARELHPDKHGDEKEDERTSLACADSFLFRFRDVSRWSRETSLIRRLLRAARGREVIGGMLSVIVIAANVCLLVSSNRNKAAEAK